MSEEDYTCEIHGHHCQDLTYAWKEYNDVYERYFTLRENYNALIMAVARKFDNETRHETALRYIREAEMVKDEPEKSIGSAVMGRRVRHDIKQRSMQRLQIQD